MVRICAVGLTALIATGFVTVVPGWRIGPARDIVIVGTIWAIVVVIVAGTQPVHSEGGHSVAAQMVVHRQVADEIARLAATGQGTVQREGRQVEARKG